MDMLRKKRVQKMQAFDAARRRQRGGRKPQTGNKGTEHNMNNSEGAQVWDAIRDLLTQSSWRLAYGKDPWVIYATGRDDADHSKEQNLTEQQYSCETDDFVREFIATRQIPLRCKNIVRFYAGQRLDWASQFVRVMLTPAANGKLAIEPPSLNGAQFLEWLLITAYKSRFQPHFRFSNTTAEKALTSIWA